MQSGCPRSFTGVPTETLAKMFGYCHHLMEYDCYFYISGGWAVVRFDSSSFPYLAKNVFAMPCIFNDDVFPQIEEPPHGSYPNMSILILLSSQPYRLIIL